MTYSQDVTICMTMGLRPNHLRQTINSLGDDLRRLPIVAINDFGDEATNDVFAELCPHGTLIDLGEKAGHNPAVDAIYKAVQTQYVFHIEDDWEFTRTDFIEDAIDFLSAYPEVTNVCFRSVSDMKIKSEASKNIKRLSHGGIDYLRLDGTHDDFFGYTFNPHLALRSLWEDLGGFSQFRGERRISQHFRKQGRYCVFQSPGSCHHIGWRQSVRRGHIKSSSDSDD